MMLQNNNNNNNNTSTTKTKTKTIRFDRRVSIVRIDSLSSYTDEEISKSWYTAGECRSFKQHRRQEIDAVRRSAAITFEQQQQREQEQRSRKIQAVRDLLLKGQELQHRPPATNGSSSTANERWLVTTSPSDSRLRKRLTRQRSSPSQQQQQQQQRRNTVPLYLPQTSSQERWSSSTCHLPKDLSPFMPMRRINTPPLLQCALR